MQAAILYEHPLSERIRLFMRLEYFLRQTRHYLASEHLFDGEASVFAAIEIINQLERNDVRNEIMKELDKHITNLSRLLNTPAVDHAVLEDTIDILNTHLQETQRISSISSRELKNDELLNTLRQRFAINSTMCTFDIPGFYYFLNQPHEIKKARIENWLNAYKPLQDSIIALLNILRDSAFFEIKTATAGFYQRSLDAQRPAQMVRVVMPQNSTVYPEISGGKHRVNVRFLSQHAQGRPEQYKDDIQFEISCCVI